MAEVKPLLLRLDQDLADRLQAVATVEGTSMSEVARTAIAQHIEKRRKDPKFRKRLEETLARNEQLLRLLDGDS